jgi:hypothetical protein
MEKQETMHTIKSAPFTEEEMMSPIASDKNWENYIYNKALYEVGNAIHKLETNGTIEPQVNKRELMVIIRQLEK